MSYNSTYNFFSCAALFHTSAFLKEVLAFQMQDILFLELNFTISSYVQDQGVSHACCLTEK